MGGRHGVKKNKKKNKLGRVFKSTTVRETQQRKRCGWKNTPEREREETDVEE